MKGVKNRGVYVPEVLVLDCSAQEEIGLAILNCEACLSLQLAFLRPLKDGCSPCKNCLPR
jgi:hypothetical protein